MTCYKTNDKFTTKTGIDKSLASGLVQLFNSFFFQVRVSYSPLSHQRDTVQSRGQLPQKNVSKETGTSGASHLIFLQQPSLLLATFPLSKPLSQKSSPTGKIINGTYLPILNSYPCITPHSSKKSSGKSPSKDESQNLSKTVCTEHKSEDKTESTWAAPITRESYCL